MNRSAVADRTRSQSVPWWELAVLTLVFARLYLPAEASEQGLTLWLAAAGYLLLAVRMWRGWRQEEAIEVRPPSWGTVGLIMLVVGHLLSGAMVFLVGGDRRATLNLCWEWGAVGAVLICLRSLLRSRSLSQLLAPGLMIAVTTLATLGIWQYAVWYPQISAVANRLADLDSRREQLTANERAELKQAERRIPGYVDKDPTAQKMLLARLRSTEPIGRFALANSFAGLLIIGSLIAAALAWRSRHEWRVAVPALLCLMTMLGCLALTESRTAKVGFACGTMVLFACLWTQRRERSAESTARSALWTRWLLVGCVVLSCGGLFVTVMYRDRLSGPLLSLKYRVEYWVATTTMLLDQPLFGSGPGNFRQTYLQYKLAGSSEEILDPHNLVLDAWANGGLPGLIGLLILLWRGVFSLLSGQQISTNETGRVPWPTRLLLACAPIVLVLAAQYVLEGQPDDVLGWLLIPASLTALLFGCRCELPGAGVLAAWVALSLHLCGAGGISMIAILQLWLVLWLLLEVETSSPLPCWRRYDALMADRLWILGGTVALLLALGCLWTGVIPTLATTGLLSEAEFAQQQGQSQRAESLLLAATEMDSLAPEPWQSLALFYMSEWQLSPRTRADDFDHAIQAQLGAIKRDPRAGKRYLILGEWWSLKYAASQRASDAEAAIAAFEQGVRRYPNHAPLHAALAEILARSGHDAQAAAQQAIDLDNANHAAGHFDKYLPEEQRERLRALGVEH